MTTALTESAAPGARVRTRRVFVPLAMLVALMAAVGFWPSYFGLMLNGTLAAPTVIHLHAAVFVSWLGLFIAQAAFAATGRIAIHKQLGPWLFAFGVLLIAMGLIAAFARFGHYYLVEGNLEKAQNRLFGPVRDMIFFAPLLAAGWIYRRQPEVHKRIMLVATSILLVAAVGRMSFLGKPVPEPLFLLVWPVPIYIAMAHDYATKRLIHPVYVIGLAAMVAMRLVVPLRGSDAWLALTGWLATLYR
jgi:hypothetical protein